MKKAMRITFALVLLVSCLLCVGCSMISPATSHPSSDAASKPTHTFSAMSAALSFEDLCNHETFGCTYIVRGKVVRQDPAVDVGDTVRTSYHVEVSSVIKGDVKVGEEVSFWMIGGESPTKIMINEDQPPLENGHESYFFIFSDGSRYSQIDMQDGKIRIFNWMDPELFKSAYNNAEFVDVTPEELEEIVKKRLTK